MERIKIKEFCDELQKEKTPFILLIDEGDSLSFFGASFDTEKNGKVCDMLAGFFVTHLEAWDYVCELIDMFKKEQALAKPQKPN